MANEKSEINNLGNQINYNIIVIDLLIINFGFQVNYFQLFLNSNYLIWNRLGLEILGLIIQHVTLTTNTKRVGAIILLIFPRPRRGGNF